MLVSYLWLMVAGISLVSAAPRIKRQASRGPLYDYVHADDGMFTWEESGMVVQDGFTTFFLNVTSQQWYDDTLSSRPVWFHYVTVHIPDGIRYSDSAFLYIGGGRNTDNLPSVDDDIVRQMGAMAASSGFVTGVVEQIPNQPIIMENDGVERVEDDYIAWTWRRFYNETHDGIDNPEIVARMPMCKGAVRAMDAMQEFVQGRIGTDIENFMIAGMSKRGWTTWLTAAIDDRVIAMAPVVLTCLNMIENFHHYWQALGGWSWVLFDYWSFGIMGLIDEPEMGELEALVDPYSYREWLTMPKLIISGASDEFFMPDDFSYFFDDLPGEKHIWILENSGHGLDDGPLGDDYWATIETFYLGVLQSFPTPAMDWSVQYTDDGGSIVVLSQSTPLNISVWSAPSIVPHRRDFRLVALDENQIPTPSGIVWTESQAVDLGNGYYEASFDNPAEGYFCFFIKVTYPGPEGRPYYFTSEVAILPNNFPYPDCTGAECHGTLL